MPSSALPYPSLYNLHVNVSAYLLGIGHRETYNQYGRRKTCVKMFEQLALDKPWNLAYKSGDN